MAFGLKTEGGGGDYTPILKFDARAGRMFRVDRTQDSTGSWNTDPVEITNGFQAVMDFENVEVGWALFAANIAPSFVMGRYLDMPKNPDGSVQLPPCPSKDHKQSFRINLKLGKASGGDVREFASQAKAVIGGLDPIHTIYEAEKSQHPGQLPLVALTSVKPIVTTGKGQSSTNYQPVFEIVRWLDRPEGLGDGQAAPAASPAPAPPEQPAPQAAREPAMADDDVF